jgi:hypothetical protein
MEKAGFFLMVFVAMTTTQYIPITGLASLPDVLPGSSVRFDFPVYSIQRDGSNISRGTIHIVLSTTPATFVYERLWRESILVGNIPYRLRDFVYSWNTTVEVWFEGIPRREQDMFWVEFLYGLRVSAGGGQMFHLFKNGTYYAVPGYVQGLWGWGYNWYNLHELPDRYMPTYPVGMYLPRNISEAESKHFKFTFNSVNVTTLETLKTIRETEVVRLFSMNESPFQAEGEALYLTIDVEARILIYTLDGFRGEARLHLTKYTPISTLPKVPSTDFYRISISDGGVFDSSGRIFWSNRELLYIPAENTIEPIRPPTLWPHLPPGWASITQSGISILLSVGEDLRTAYDRLKANYDGLRRDYEGLMREYEGLWRSHDRLKVDYDRLRRDYDVLKVDYEGLKVDHHKLKVDYMALKADYDALIGGLIIWRNLMYALTGFTVILMFAVIYLLKRGRFHTYPRAPAPQTSQLLSSREFGVKGGLGR